MIIGRDGSVARQSISGVQLHYVANAEL
jgi:hypothetical protein